MFASIRQYVLQSGDMQDLAQRVDRGFAEEISAQPGFVSYEFIDCGDGRVATVTMFGDSAGAEESRDLAQRWTEDNLQDLEFDRLESLSGRVLVSRAAEDMLEPGHVGAGRGYASLRRYRTDSSSVAEMMHIADAEFADRVAETEGFEAYHVIDCGDGEIAALSLMRDRESVTRTEEMAREFVTDRLAAYDIEHIESLTGQVSVSRAMEALLEPTHA